MLRGAPGYPTRKRKPSRGYFMNPLDAGGSMSTVYDSDYYHNLQDGSSRSAKVVIPILLERFGVKSVIDIGCGTGGWLSEFARAGISDYLGIDGDYVPRKFLKIPESCFRAVDLTTV